MAIWNQKPVDKAKPSTAKAYSTVMSLLAPDLCGESGASDHQKKLSCQFVRQHWQLYGQGTMIPADVRVVLDHWAPED